MWCLSYPKGIQDVGDVDVGSVSHFCSVFYNVGISQTLLVGQLNMLNQCLKVDERLPLLADQKYFTQI